MSRCVELSAPEADPKELVLLNENTSSAAPPPPRAFYQSPLAIHALAILFLLVLTFAAYSNSFSGVIEGDAGMLVSADSRVHDVTAENLKLIATKPYWSAITASNVYRPLVTLSWMLNYAVFGNENRSLGYHIFNLVWHAINVILVWLLVLRIWNRPLGAFLAAAVFALHPVNTEAVTNIVGRADLMAAAGVLAGLLLHLALPQKSVRKRMAILAGIALASAFGFLSKENAIVLPALMLLYDVVFRAVPRRASLGSVALGYVAALAPVLPVLAWRFTALHGITDVIFAVDNPLVTTGFWTARLTAIEIIWRNIALLAWPQHLSWDYSYSQIPFATITGGVAALVALALVLIVLASLYRRAAVISFFGLFFFAALAPTSNVFFLIGSIRAERLLYLSSVGFAVCVIAIGTLFFEGILVNVKSTLKGMNHSHAAWSMAAVFCVVLFAFAARTRARNAEWTDGPKLWEADVVVAPNSFKTHMGRINALYRSGMNSFSLDEAIEEAQKATEIVATLPAEQSTVRPLETLGSLYQLKGDTLYRHGVAQLISFTGRESSQETDSPDQWYQKALDTYAQAAELDSREREFRKEEALARGVPSDTIRYGGSSFLYSHMADTYRHLGRFHDALKALRHLSAIAPTDPAVYDQISQLYRASGSPGDAVINLWKSEFLRPDSIYESDLMRLYRALGAEACAVAD